MSLRRLNRIPKTLARKGKPGTPRRRVVERIDPQGRKRDWHPTKGWRRAE